MKYKLVDLPNWVRREHYLFFRNFEEPVYGVTVKVDCTIAYQQAKARGISFFLYSVHCALQAAQHIENFRLRIVGEEVYDYDVINGGAALPRENGTFGFGFFDFHSDMDAFIEKAESEIKRVQAREDLERPDRVDQIRFSSLPWLDFTSLSHARMFLKDDSCPRITFGKMTTADDKRSMPVAIHVHHGFVDGVHIGLFVESFQKLLDQMTV